LTEEADLDPLRSLMKDRGAVLFVPNDDTYWHVFGLDVAAEKELARTIENIRMKRLRRPAGSG
jgi:hypothetical protein